MKTLIVSILVAFSLSSFAEKPPFDINEKPKTEEERQIRKAWFEKKQLEHTGGFIVRPGTQAGEIVYVNCQNRADRKWIDESVDYFKKQTKFNITVKEGGVFNLANPKIEGNASLFIVDDAALPPILLAPESRWAMVNIASLTTNKPVFFEARVKKALTRGFALLCGASNSQYPLCLTGGITGPAGLDKCIDLRLQADVLSRFPSYMAAFGVRPASISTYRQACKEGWAPAPTNEVQTAIWNRVHEIPSEPLKIEFKK